MQYLPKAWINSGYIIHFSDSGARKKIFISTVISFSENTLHCMPEVIMILDSTGSSVKVWHVDIPPLGGSFFNNFWPSVIERITKLSFLNYKSAVETYLKHQSKYHDKPWLDSASPTWLPSSMCFEAELDLGRYCIIERRNRDHTEERCSEGHKRGKISSIVRCKGGMDPWKNIRAYKIRRLTCTQEQRQIWIKGWTLNRTCNETIS